MGGSLLALGLALGVGACADIDTGQDCESFERKYAECIGEPELADDYVEINCEEGAGGEKDEWQCAPIDDCDDFLDCCENVWGGAG